MTMLEEEEAKRVTEVPLATATGTSGAHPGHHTTIEEPKTYVLIVVLQILTPQDVQFQCHMGSAIEREGVIQPPQ